MVQAGGDEQTVQEGVDAHADDIQPDDGLAHGIQRAEDDGPHEQQDDGGADGHHAGDDGHAALAAEEGQPVRQLGVLELVVAGGANQARDDGGEHVLELLEGQQTDGIVVDGGHNGGDHAGGQQGLHHQEADQAGQGGGAVLIVGHAHGHADDEQPVHVVDERAAGLDQQEAHGKGRAGGGRAGHAHNAGSQGVPQAHQDTADGKGRYGQHQGFAQFL